MDPFLMSFAPFESPYSQLSNGAKLIKNGSTSNKLIRLTCHWVAKISGTYMGTYFVRENRSTRLVHNFLNIDPFLMIFVLFENFRAPLSNGMTLITI